MGIAATAACITSIAFACEVRLEALRQRGLGPAAPALDLRTANRAIALRLAAIACLVAAAVAASALLYRFMP